MLTRFASLVQVRPSEFKLVAYVAALFAFIQAGQGIGANAADGLFFKEFGVNFLPYMFMALGVLTFVITLVYSAALIRIQPRIYFPFLLLLMAAVLLLERASLVLALPALFPVLWLTVNVVNALLGTIVWYLAGEVCDTRQAKRLFSIFASAGILGGVVGNLITGTLAQTLGTENLLILDAVLILATIGFTRVILRRFFHPPVKRTLKAGLLSDLTVGYDYVRRHRLLRLTAYSSVLFSILFFAISFPFSQAVSAAYPNAADVAGFLGLFSGIVTAISFVVSLLLAGRIFTRLGVVNAVLLLPVAYLAAFVLWSINFSLVTAALARLVQMVLLFGLVNSAWSAMFNVVPAERRGQVLGFDAGVPQQIGIVLSGVLLILGETILSNSQILVMGMVVALACAYLVWRMRAAYGEALVQALRNGHFEVFSGGIRALSNFRGDANARRVALAALEDAKPSTRRLGAEILAKMGDSTSVPALVGRLNDDEPEVRVAALQALGDLDAQDAAPSVLAHVNDSDPRVRASALRLLPKLQPQGTTPFVTAAAGLSDDADVQVRANVAVALAKWGEAEQAEAALGSLLGNPDSETRVLALRTLSAAVDGNPARFEIGPVVEALSDPAPSVRSAACEALGLWKAENAVDPLLTRLGDEDEEVRLAAAHALRRFGDGAAAGVIRVLSRGSDAAQTAALEALRPNDPTLLAPLHDYALRQIAQARAAREQALAIPNSGRVTRLLCELLETRAALNELHLVKTLGLLGNAEVMDLVSRSLKTRSAENHAEAIETLETLGNKQLAREIVPLLDEAPAADRLVTLTCSEALAELFAQNDIWVRALAARAAAETRSSDLIPNLRILAEDHAAVVRSAACEALAQLGEKVPMETLQTVSLLERILLLREVPLFADLSPDDLSKLADVAREQLYPDGALLCREGDEGTEMFVIASGQVRVTKKVDGGEKLLALRGQGEFIGEMSIIEMAPRFADVRAQGEVRALVISAKAFKSILRDRPEVSLAVLRGLSRRLRERA